jgi:hypothetical protein
LEVFEKIQVKIEVKSKKTVIPISEFRRKNSYSQKFIISRAQVVLLALFAIENLRNSTNTLDFGGIVL